MTRKSLIHIGILGWLMGLEPTTTGITIPPYNPASMRVCGVFMGINTPICPLFRLGSGDFIPTESCPGIGAR